MRHSTGSMEERALPSIGDRVEVWWNGDKKYYSGRVVSQLASGKMKVSYDDGDQENLDFCKERWRTARSTDVERPRRHSGEPPRKRASAAAGASASSPTAKNTPTWNSRKRTMSANGNASGGASASGSGGGSSKAKRARNEDDTAAKSGAGGGSGTGKEDEVMVQPGTQAEDLVLSSTGGSTEGGPVTLTVSVQEMTKVMSSVLAAESVEWRKRNSALQRRLTAVEMKLAEATTEISALRGQLAALRAVSPPQAAAARDAVRDVVHEMARALLRRDNNPNQTNN